MKQVIRPAVIWPFWLCIPCLLMADGIFADQVDMQNGDRYLGDVVSLNKETLVLQNEVLGTVKLPRAKVAAISFGNALKNSMAAAGRQTNAVADPILAGLSTNSNLIARVQKQFLSGAGDEAQDKFNELVSGLLTGKLTVEDVRAQARAAAEQVRAYRKELGDSAGGALDGYLAILDQFLGESSAPAKANTNSPPRKPKPADLLED